MVSLTLPAISISPAFKARVECLRDNHAEASGSTKAEVCGQVIESNGESWRNRDRENDLGFLLHFVSFRNDYTQANCRVKVAGNFGALYIVGPFVPPRSFTYLYMYRRKKG